MKNDIRLQTVLIIKKDNYYLVSRSITGNIIWRQDYSDAWRTRVRAAARSIAEKTGGEIYLFNPVVCQLKKYVG